MRRIRSNFKDQKSYPGLLASVSRLAVCSALSMIISTTALAEVKEFTLTVTDGSKDLMGNQIAVMNYNGTVPGPEIRVKEGDIVRIKLRNMSGEKHGLFFHGLHLPPLVSMQEEVPVEPGYEYTYEFEAKPSGTHLYHCSWNMAEHLNMGLYGAFIVEGKDEKKFDKEFVYVLNDWSSKAARGEGQHERGHPRTLMDNDITTINDIVVKGDNPVIIDMMKGEQIRLRLANIGHLPHKLSFANGFIVTHEDGYAVPEPQKKDELIIYSGKSYDIVLTADRMGNSPFFHSVTMPKGARQLLMEEQAGHTSKSWQMEDMRAEVSDENVKTPMQMAMEKEVRIIVLKVKGAL